MTLVIAGLLDDTTCFFCADSTISSGRKTLLSGFRKIYSIPVATWEPAFIGEHFNGYHHQVETTNAAVAFAGNTLTAQHLLNTISSHLAQLRISWSHAQERSVLLRHCDRSNPLHDARRAWSEDMFGPGDLQGLLTCDVVFDTVLYSANEAVASAKKYKLDATDFASLQTSLLVAAFDPHRRKTRLARFHLGTRLEPDGLAPYFEVSEVPYGELGLIGEKELVQGQHDIRRLADAERISLDAASLRYLTRMIDDWTQKDRRAIDYPAVLKMFESGSLRVEKTCTQSPAEPIS